jgi:hypothetical protein
MLGWLATRNYDTIKEEAVEMVGAMEEVAYTNTITKLGECIMTDVVELCTILTSKGPDIMTTCNTDDEVGEEEQDHSHHQEDPLKEEGVPGDKAVIPACSNGMPGSISQASPGGTCPRTSIIDNFSNLCTIEEDSERGQREKDHMPQGGLKENNPGLFMTVDNDNTTKSITLVVIRHALLMVMMATGMLMDYTPLNLDNTLSFVV